MKKWLILAGSIAAALPLLSGLWIALDWLEIRPVYSREIKFVQAEIDTLTQNANLALWQQLNSRLRNGGGLNDLERQQYCALSIALKFHGIPECGI